MLLRHLVARSGPSSAFAAVASSSSSCSSSNAYFANASSRIFYRRHSGRISTVTSFEPLPTATAPSTRSTMPDSMILTFLGTAAGKPSQTRNVSSLALKVDKSIWVVDAGEATQHQFQRSKLKMSQITHIFITHMHGDHVNGLPGLLCTASEGHMAFDGSESKSYSSSSSEEPITTIYGPSGLRLFLRTTLSLTHSHLTRPYVVHELLFPNEPECPCSSTDLHPVEKTGQNIRIDSQSQGWPDFTELKGVRVSAGPIKHTIPCLGYVFTELPRPLPLDPSLYIPHLKRNSTALLATQGIKNPLSLLSVLTSQRKSITLPDGTILDPPGMGPKGRKIVILGDTYDALGGSIERWSESADLVIHEATNAYLPTWDESQRGRSEITQKTVREKAKEHGHSTPEGAGEFANRVKAKKLVMNHLSTKYTDYGDGVEGEVESESRRVGRGMLKEMEEIATKAWGKGTRALTARDFMEIEIKRTDKV